MSTPQLLGFGWASDREVTVRVRRADGLVGTVTYGWATPDLAREHYQDAVAGALTAATVMREPGDNRRMRRVVTRYGTAYLSLNTGPPTWWAPRVRVGRRKDGAHEFMVGWLRALVAVAWHPKERA